MSIISKSIIKIIAIIFTTFLAFKYLASRILLILLKYLPFQITDNLQNVLAKISSQESCERQQKIQASECFQLVLDSAISLLFTTIFVNYNQVLIEFTLLISHHTHHSFLKLVFQDIPDYSSYISSSQTNVIMWIYIVCGLFGFSTQIALSLDIINILTLPTKVIYKFLAFFYKKSLDFTKKLIQFITKNDQKWITSKYPQIIRNESFKIIAIILVVIILQILLLTIFYYGWLAIVIFCLFHVEKILSLLYVKSMNIGQCIFILKGLKCEDSKRKITWNIFDLTLIIKIIKGIDILKKNSINIKIKSSQKYNLSLRKVYSAFLFKKTNQFKIQKQKEQHIQQQQKIKTFI